MKNGRYYTHHLTTTSHMTEILLEKKKRWVDNITQKKNTKKHQKNVSLKKCTKKNWSMRFNVTNNSNKQFEMNFHSLIIKNHKS